MTLALLRYRDTSQSTSRARYGVHWLEWAAVGLSFLLAALVICRLLDDAFTMYASALAIALLAGWIVVQDLGTLTIADGAVVSIAVLALAIRGAAGDNGIAIALDCLLTGGILLAFREIYYRHRGFDGLGLGDVKLAAAGGLLIGASAFAWVLLAASLLCLGLVVVRQSTTDKLAYGAFLAPTIWLAWVVQHAPLLLRFPTP